MGAILMVAHVRTHLTPAQAAQAAGVSRWAIMRAIKSMKLRAIRDNRNFWSIAPDDLADWCTAQGVHTVRTGADILPAHPSDIAELSELRSSLAASRAAAELLAVRLEAANSRADAAQADRDHWRDLAGNLAARPRFRFWPWR